VILDRGIFINDCRYLLGLKRGNTVNAQVVKALKNRGKLRICPSNSSDRFL
jgi:hypothetical protein